MARAQTRSPMLSQELLLSVAEELKLPLLQIARIAELGQTSTEPDLSTIRSTAEMALRLLDNYALGVRLNMEPQHLLREPVSVASVLYDAGQQLDSYAKSYGIALDLNVAGKFGPVMAHRKGLQAALVSLGAALIEALPASETPQLKLQLATHRCRYGIVAGLYADMPQLTNQALQQGRKLVRQSRQPLLNITHANGAGIFVADTILQSMDLNLRASRHHRLYGLGTVLQPTNQLQLV